MLVRSLLVWLALLALAIINGAFREVMFTPRLGSYAAHLLSTFMLCTLILALTSATIAWIGPRDSAAAWTIGFTWLALTLAFEFLAGHYVFGSPWSKLTADYDVLNGRVWVLVLLTTAAAPALMSGWRLVLRQ
jgi:hypothetical protein